MQKQLNKRQALLPSNIKLGIDESDEDDSPDSEDLPLHRSYSLPKLSQDDDADPFEDDDNDDPLITDNVKNRLKLARQAAVAKHKEVWGISGFLVSLLGLKCYGSTLVSKTRSWGSTPYRPAIFVL